MRDITKIATLLGLVFLCSNLVAQDWANLNRFKSENEKLEMPAKNENRVVFMGNSITEGWSNLAPEFFTGKPYINRGISGQTTPQMLVRFRQDVIDLKPRVVIILAGTNDIAGNTGPATLVEIAENIESMAQLAKANGIKVILSSVLPAFDYAWRPGLDPASKIPKLNLMIRNFAEVNKMIYLDYFSTMTDGKNGLPKHLSPDGVHPNKDGYLMMAPLAEAAIQQALK